MNPEKLNELIDRLISRTEAGSLKWKEGVQPGTFQVSFPDYSVILHEGAGLAARIAGSVPSLRVLDNTGDVVVSVEALSVTAALESAAAAFGHRMQASAVDAGKLERLVKTVRGTIVRSREKVIDKLIEHLG
jgi:hypothetical protein